MVDYVIVWDLETVPDADAFARVYGLLNPSPSKIHEIIGMEFPKLPLHRIVCIGAAHRAFIEHCGNSGLKINRKKSPGI